MVFTFIGIYLPLYENQENPFIIVCSIIGFPIFVSGVSGIFNKRFINVSKNYDFDLLSDNDIVALIEEKKKKDLEKIVKNWTNENITIEKARWGRHNIIKGKLKIQLPKNKDVSKITLKEVQTIIKNNSKTKKSKN